MSIAAQRILNVQSPVIPIVAEWIAEHPGTISLGQGVVHYGPPHSVIESVRQALDSEAGIHRYGSVRGNDFLLHLIQAKVTSENGIDLQQQCALVTAGSNMGFLTAILAIGDPGDEVILPGPYYFNQHMAIEIAGCRPVVVPTNAEFQLDIAAVESALTPRTRAVVTISPNNPTGAVYSPASLAAINELCRQQGCYHISDEAYEYFTYGDVAHFSPASLPSASSHTISLFTLSKAFGMAGWRCGYIVLPKHLEVAAKKLLDTNLICAPQICQVAAAAALTSGRDWVRTQMASLRDVRDVALEELSSLGTRCQIARPDGALYLLLGLDTQSTDMELARALIREAGVATLPGSTFGINEGCSLRISYGGLVPEMVTEGLRRLRSGLERIL